MKEELLQYLSSRIREEQKQIENDMAMGSAKTYEDYRFAAGIYRGLLIANNLILETAERLETHDE